MIRVVLTFPNGQRREVLLAGVPRIGDSIRLENGPGTSPSFMVEHVLWMEWSNAGSDPSVVVVVRPHTEGPMG